MFQDTTSRKIYRFAQRNHGKSFENFSIEKIQSNRFRIYYGSKYCFECMRVKLPSGLLYIVDNSHFLGFDYCEPVNIPILFNSYIGNEKN